MVTTSAGVFSRSLSLFYSFFPFPAVPRLTVPAADWQNGVLVIDPAVDYTLTWAPFTGAQVNDLIQLIIAGSVVNPSPFPGTQTSYVIPAGSLQPGTEYAANLAFIRVINVAAADADFGQGLGARVSNTGFTIRTLAPVLALTSAVSRKQHGVDGPIFDVNLPLAGTAGVESRTGGSNGEHTIVFTFSNPVVGGNATVTSGSGSIPAAPLFMNNTMTVVLSGVANEQRSTITLTNVTDSFGQVLPNSAVIAGFLLGDVNGSGRVTSTDLGPTKLQSGQAVNAENFPADINVSGVITASDVGQVKLQSGTMLP